MALRERKAPVKAPPARILDVEGAEGFITVKRGRFNMGKLIFEKEDLDTITVPWFNGPIARVKISSSTTRNLGDYNSVKVEVSLDLPCYAVPGEIEHTYNQAADWVCAKIESELDDGGQTNG